MDVDGWRLLPRCAVAALALFAGVDAGQIRVLAALKEFDRVSSRQMWPRFEPAGISLDESKSPPAP